MDPHFPIAPALLLTVLSLVSLPVAHAAGCPGEALWSPFVHHFVSPDGRVVDRHTPAHHTTSEGQAYALFFALVADDREHFERLLRWTEANLAGGDLTARLPAWQWGRDGEGAWRVLDDNAASDADLWLAYTLGEAGRIWGDGRLAALGELLAERILAEERMEIPGLGPVLLPGPRGFRTESGGARLNPSYLPLQLLRRLHTLYPGHGWGALLESSRRLLQAFPSGLQPDWLLARPDGALRSDPHKGPHGSYDAIRVYLWAGMLDGEEPLRREVLDHLAPMARLTAERGVPPLRVDVLTGKAEGSAPPGFSAALLPFLASQGEPEVLRQQCLRLRANPLSRRPDHYYEQVLALFGLGWLQGQYRFGADGRLILPREGS